MKRAVRQSFDKIKGTAIFKNFLNLSSIQLSNILLNLALFPIIIRLIGIEAFGYFTLANSIAWVFAILINYGTNQSGIRDIAIHIADPGALGKIFYNILGIRILMFIFFLVCIALLGNFQIKYYHFILFAVPIVFSEVFNPLFFFLGIQKLKAFNIANLLSKALTIVFVVLFIHSPDDAVWVNFIIGVTSLVLYCILLVNQISSGMISFHMPRPSEQIHLFKENFSLTINNISVQLQQSFMVFALGKWESPRVLGAYSVADKVIGSIRILIIQISSAIYPKAAQMNHTEPERWHAFMKKTQLGLTALFLSGSVILCLCAPVIVKLISGKADSDATAFLRIMAFVPAVAAWNSCSAIDLLIRNDKRQIFKIAILLLIISLVTTFILVSRGYSAWYGAYTLAVELAALLMYQFAIQKSRKHSLSKDE